MNTISLGNYTIHAGDVLSIDGDIFRVVEVTSEVTAILRDMATTREEEMFMVSQNENIYIMDPFSKKDSPNGKDYVKKFKIIESKHRTTYFRPKVILRQYFNDNKI